MILKKECAFVQLCDQREMRVDEDKGQVGITACAGWGGVYEQYLTCTIIILYRPIYKYDR